MPTFGGVKLPDDFVMPTSTAPRERPSIGSIIGASAEKAVRQVAAAIPYQFDTLTLPQVSAEAEARYQQGLAEANAAAARAAPAQLDDMTSGRVGLGRWIAENLAASVPQTGAILAGGFAGGLAGGPVGALAGATAVGTPLFSASNVGRAVEEQGALTVDAAERSLLTAPVQAGAESLIGRFLPGVGKLLGSTASTQAGGFIRRTAQSMAKAGATEAVTEASQQLGERFAAGIPLTGSEAAAEYMNAAVTAFAVGGVLGAGGGFRRRSDTERKPASEVTTDDITNKFNEVVLGLPAPDPNIARDADGNQLTLPAPTPTARDRFGNQVGIPHLSSIARDADGNQLGLPGLPRGLPAPDAPAALDADGNQLALPSPGSFGRDPAGPDVGSGPAVTMPTPTDVFVDSAGRAALNPRGIVPNPNGVDPVILANTPRSSIDNIDPAADRPLQKLDDAVLERVRKDANATPEIIAVVEQELETRLQENPFKGLRTNQDTAKLKGKDPEAIRTGVLELLEKGDARPSTLQLAERLRIDLNAPGEALPEVSLDTVLAPPTAQAAPERGVGPVAQPAPQPPVTLEEAGASTELPAAPISSPAPAQADPAAPISSPAPTQADPADLEAVAAAKQAIGVRRAGDLATLNTPAEVFNQLAVDRRKAKRDGDATRVEKMAKLLGLVTNDRAMDYTPRGREVFLQSDQGPEAIASAAADNGYAGDAATQFELGAQAAVGGARQTSFATLEERVAYNAGEVWAADFVRNGEVLTAAETKSRQKADDEVKQGTRQALGVKNITPKKARDGVERATLTPAQIQQRALSNFLDSVDMTGISESDRTALRLMTRNPKTTTWELGAAIERVQQGGTTFTQPPTAAPTAPAPLSRGQPKFVEMNTATGSNMSRADMRAETERAVIVRELGELIGLAQADGTITPSRAVALRRMLSQGKVEQVAKQLKNFDPDAEPKVAAKSRVEKIADPVAVQQAVVHDQLTAREKKALADHYNEKTYNKAAKARFMADVSTAISDGLDKVSEVVRAVLRRIGEGVMALAVVFNPATLTEPNIPIMAQAHAAAPTKVPTMAAGQMSAASKQVYQRMAAMAKANGAGFMIVDKAGSKVHIFNKDGGHIVSDTVLTGATKEDFFDAQRMAATSVDAITQKVTPAGMFTTQLFRQSNAEGSPIGFLLNDADGNNNFIAMHTTTIDERLPLFNTPGVEDNAVSFGCVNLNPKLYEEKILPNIEQFQNNLVFVIPYDLAQLEKLLPPEGTVDAPRPTAPLKQSGADRREVFDRRAIPVQDAADMIQPAYTASRASEAFRTRVAELVEGREGINPFSADNRTKLQRTLLGGVSMAQIVRWVGQRMPEVRTKYNLDKERTTNYNRLMQIGNEVDQGFAALERSNPNAAKWLNQLMQTTTKYRLDPEKKWEEHTWLQGDKDAAQFKRLHGEAVKLRNDLRRGKGEGWKQYEAVRDLNKAENYMRLSGELYNLVAKDRELTLGVRDSGISPFDAFMASNTTNTPQDILAYWEKALDDQTAAATEFVREKMGAVARANDPAATEAARAQSQTINAQLQAIGTAKATMNNYPYFHIGRFGDNYGSVTLRKGEDGRVDPDARDAFADAVEAAGFDDISISSDDTNPRVATRFETEDAAIRFRQLMVELHGKGLLDGDLGDIHVGPRDMVNNRGTAAQMPANWAQLIADIDQSEQFKPADGATAETKAALAKAKAAAKQQVHDAWIDSQPYDGVARVLTKRFNIPGASKNMRRNWAYRWSVGAAHNARLSVTPKYDKVYTDMRARVAAARSADAVDDPWVLQNVMGEIQRRDAGIETAQDTGFLDKVRAVSNSFFLGLSPAFGMINMTQPWVLGWPELAKQHGYKQSFAAMRRASTTAVKILRAVGAEGYRAGWRNIGDGTLTDSALKAAGLSEEERQFIRHIQATGSIDIGSMAHALGRVVDGEIDGNLDTYLRMSSSVGLYTEMFGRLTMALSARELYKGGSETVHQYASRVIDEAMLNYQNTNTPRWFGRDGLAGQATPIFMQFQSYAIQVSEKLFSEVVDAFAKPRIGESAEAAAERRRASRKFVAGHLAIVTGLAGTLGLPLATVFASVLERIVDTIDDDEEPFDATAAWRNFLANVFGKDVAEVVARGLPRAAGFDLSTRAGEQNLFIGTEFLADRRDWKTAVESAAGRSIGAAPSMVTGVLDGFGKVLDGDVVGGAKSMLPIAFRNIVEAGRMTADGTYVDGKGNEIPVRNPGAASILWQMLGFSPDEKAEFSEQRGDQYQRRMLITRQRDQLTQGIVRNVLQNGDPDQLRALIDKAIAFDQSNQEYALLPGIADTIERHLQTRAQARALGTPAGVSPTDIAAQRLTQYANN